ncbi:acyl-CoA thioesterase [Helicobacter enhydrae]|uniref:Acyl-CoA thioesterase n=1 Tax=Helicobacter enhydrae TaxID=222136 RepID=A0A1B1U3I3_9HELI|nr:acyl-CoA thioesterase [Helicobacter enhydrae]ANV97334.1 acyl-CoA thioesterase [Helicobacter enhydrae]
MECNTLKMSILVSPSVANFSGVMHGGELLKTLDHVAYACATKYCGYGVVTISVDQVIFKSPIPIGSLLNFYASVNYVGKSSCEVGIRVECEDLKSRAVKHCSSAYFTMVALGANRQKVAMPPFVPQSDEQKRRYAEAIDRREKRSMFYATKQ